MVKKNIKLRKKVPSTTKKPPAKKQPPTPPKILWVEPELFQKISKQVYALLPQKPYKIGINKDIFNFLKAQYPEKGRKLRLVIGIKLRIITNTYNYKEALLKSEYRYGINNKRFPLDPIHKKGLRKELHEIRAARAQHLKRVKKLVAMKKYRKKRAA